jgi:hypothetical protein
MNGENEKTEAPEPPVTPVDIMRRLSELEAQRAFLKEQRAGIDKAAAEVASELKALEAELHASGWTRTRRKRVKAKVRPAKRRSKAKASPPGVEAALPVVAEPVTTTAGPGVSEPIYVPPYVPPEELAP